MTRLGSHVAADTTLRARLDGHVALLAQNPEHHFIASTVAEDIAWGCFDVAWNQPRHNADPTSER